MWVQPAGGRNTVPDCRRKEGLAVPGHEANQMAAQDHICRGPAAQGSRAGTLEWTELLGGYARHEAFAEVPVFAPDGNGMAYSDPHGCN